MDRKQIWRAKEKKTSTTTKVRKPTVKVRPVAIAAPTFFSQVSSAMAELHVEDSIANHR